MTRDDLLVFAGPCVIEDRDGLLRIAERLARVALDADVEVVFKASFDKANRSSLGSYRGPGLHEGLTALQRVKEETGLRLLTDIHEPGQAGSAAQVVDFLQIPAFLCRQTDLLLAAAATGMPVNVKKGPFLAPEQVAGVLSKVPDAWVTERGSSFGHGDLVVDFRGLVTLRELGAKVVFDATHSVQRPGGRGASSGGDRRFVPALARAAAAVGIDALYVEVHPDPGAAMSDPDTQWPLHELPFLLREVLQVHRR